MPHNSESTDLDSIRWNNIVKGKSAWQEGRPQLVSLILVLTRNEIFTKKITFWKIFLTSGCTFFYIIFPWLISASLSSDVIVYIIVTGHCFDPNVYNKYKSIISFSPHVPVLNPLVLGETGYCMNKVDSSMNMYRSSFYWTISRFQLLLKRRRALLLPNIQSGQCLSKCFHCIQ